MNILDHLLQKSNDIRRMDDFQSPEFFKMKSGETGVTRPGIDATTQFYLEATVSVTFWANPAQYHYARELAEQALLHRLYGGILGEISEVRLQVSNGCREAAMVAVNRLESKLYLTSRFPGANRE